MENKLNKLLRRQLKKHAISAEGLPAELKGLLEDINQSYENFEDDIFLLQNSIEISSVELRDAYEKHKREAESRRDTIQKIHEAISALNPAGQPSKPETPPRDDSGHSLIDALIRLIEERNKAEEEITKLSKAVEQNPASIVITNVNGEIEYVNPKFCDLTGYLKEEVIGKNPRILKPEHAPAELYVQLWQTILTGKEWHGDLQNKKKNGELYWEAASISPIINEHQKITHFIAIKEDITARRMAEAERTRQSGLITSLLDSIPDIIFFKDTSGRYLGCNPSFSDLVGLPKGEILGKNDRELFGTASANVFSQSDEEILAYRQPCQYEEWITSAGGNRVLLDTRKTPYWAGDGSLIGILGISRDITKRKDFEEALLQSSQKFEAIISASPDGIGMISLDGKLQLMSDKLATMYGYSNDQKDEYLGTTFWSFIDPSNHGLLKDNLNDLLCGRSEQKITEYLAIKKDGTRFYVDVNSTVLADSKGNPESILFIERDITERKRDEEALLNERTLFRTIIDLIPDAVYVKDMEGRKIIANPKEVQFSGKNTEAEIIGKTDFELYHNREASRGMEEDRQVLHTGHPLINIDGTLIDKDGRFHWILCSKVPLRDVHGKITGLVGVSRDITEQKQTEAVLVKAKEAADIASKAKSEFLANMSHEIRTPLNGVIGFTDLLMKTPLNRTQQQYAENVSISGHSLLAIINDILDFSKIEAGKMELDHIKSDIIELAGQTSDIIKYQAAQKGLELLLNIQPDMPRFAVVDPTRLKQVLVNLLGNAVKFTPAGEVELRVSFTRKDEITGFFSFSVRDTGIGIAADQHQNLFNAFTQADTSTTRKFGGTGLGLTISGMLVEKMGSNIEIRSELNAGSEFFFTIEAKYETGEKIDPASLTHVNRVLVIDDNLNNRLILEHTFLNWGIAFTGIDNGRKAIDIIGQSQPFDVIIVDYNMPELNGIDTIRMIMEEFKLTPEKLPAILLHSSSDNLDIFDECKKLGVRFNLTKPVKSQELLQYLMNLQNPSVQSEPGFTPTVAAELADIASHGSLVILVAEDVALNMLLVTTIIRQMLPGAMVLEAFNGKQALALSVAERPDLILMDVQMPEMSGIESAMAIRAVEQETGGHIPIVALTAGAIKGEKENCLKAGMDDFLTKPIDRDTLHKLLKKYLIPVPESQASSPVPEIPDDTSLHFNTRQLMENIGNSQELLDEILEAVPEQFSYDLQSLAQAIADHNPDGIRSAAHSIKGAALNMYFGKLAETARSIELIVEEQNSEKLGAVFNELVLEWEQVHKLLMNLKR